MTSSVCCKKRTGFGPAYEWVLSSQSKAQQVVKPQGFPEKRQLSLKMSMRHFQCPTGLEFARLHNRFCQVLRDTQWWACEPAHMPVWRSVCKTCRQATPYTHFFALGSCLIMLRATSSALTGPNLSQLCARQTLPTVPSLRPSACSQNRWS